VCDIVRFHLAAEARVSKLLLRRGVCSKQPVRAADIGRLIKSCSQLLPGFVPLAPIAHALQQVSKHAQQAVRASTLESRFQQGYGGSKLFAHDMHQRKH
jgi:hypothetical protein